MHLLERPCTTTVFPSSSLQSISGGNDRRHNDVTMLCSHALFYQSALRHIGKFCRITLSNKIQLKDLLRCTPLGTDAGASAQARAESRAELGAESGAETVVPTAVVTAATIIESHASMLADYFKIIFKDGALVALPEIIPGHIPDPLSLPTFLRDLANVRYPYPSMPLISRIWAEEG